MIDASRPRLFWPTLLTALAALLLVALGTWQLERKAWKEALIARIETGTAAEPIVLDAATALVRAGQDLEYARVRARGRFLHDKARLLYAPGAAGPGYHVYTPLQTPSGAIVMINRGFVPEGLTAQVLATPVARGYSDEVVGLLRRPPAKSWADPASDPARNRWYWRDLDGMIASIFPAARPDVLPFFLDAQAAPAPPGQPLAVPQGGVTRVQLPNRHLEYALTWYGLAATMIVVYLFVVRGARRAQRGLFSRRGRGV